VIKYKKKISGPMLDIIDIHLDVPAVKIDKLTSKEKVMSESSKTIQKRVQAARDIQTKRFKGTKTNANAEMTNKDIRKFCELSDECLNLLKLAVSKMQLSARSYQRIIKLSRTIADLEGVNEIKPQHIAESLQYRPKLENTY
jgi:magnesium chelatase family protein